MKKVRARIGKPGYYIYIGSGQLATVGRKLRAMGFTDRAVIITDPSVHNLYGVSLKQSLNNTGFKTSVIEVPVGEEFKSLESAGRLYHELTELGAERLTPILALGGGVIGDLAGFVAATYMRGVPLIQLPTTLLAQVDSSIGGKVAVNHGQLKNKIGNFYQPRMVIADTMTLKTLPMSELSSALGEVIKYAVINSEDFFVYLEENVDGILSLDEKTLEEIVARSAQIKVDVVAQDELDLGKRNVLNFGHTIGHAIETVTDFGVSHGQAVAIGMMGAAGTANEMGILPVVSVTRLRKLLKKAGLRTNLPRIEVKKIMEAMKHDKKVQSGKIKFVLPKSLGEVFVTDEVDPALVEKVLAGMR